MAKYYVNTTRVHLTLLLMLNDEIYYRHHQEVLSIIIWRQFWRVEHPINASIRYKMHFSLQRKALDEFKISLLKKLKSEKKAFPKFFYTSTLRKMHSPTFLYILICFISFCKLNVKNYSWHVEKINNNLQSKLNKETS